MVRHELSLEHSGHNLRPRRIHLSHLPEEGVAQFPLKPVSRVRGIGNVIVHGLGEESQERRHGLIMPVGRHPEPRVRTSNDYRLAHRLSLVLLRDGKRLDIIAKLQYGISYPARSRLIVTLSVCLWINHPIVLKERKEYPVNVGDILLPVWRADDLSGDYSYHILLPP